MRLLSFFFSIFGIISFIFILFSLKLINEIVYPEIENIEDSYESVAVLSGNVGRILSASELYKTKNAQYILLSKENRLIESDVLGSKPVLVYE